MSEQFLVTECFLICSQRFLISNKLEQLEFKLKKTFGIQKHARKFRKSTVLVVLTGKLMIYAHECAFFFMSTISYYKIDLLAQLYCMYMKENTFSSTFLIMVKLRISVSGAPPARRVVAQAKCDLLRIQVLSLVKIFSQV